MSVRLNPFMRCECGKLHVVSHVWWSAVCPACDRPLRDQVYRR